MTEVNWHTYHRYVLSMYTYIINDVHYITPMSGLFSKANGNLPSVYPCFHFLKWMPATAEEFLLLIFPVIKFSFFFFVLKPLSSNYFNLEFGVVDGMLMLFSCMYPVRHLELEQPMSITIFSTPIKHGLWSMIHDWGWGWLG